MFKQHNKLQGLETNYIIASDQTLKYRSNFIFDRPFYIYVKEEAQYFYIHTQSCKDKHKLSQKLASRLASDLDS